jgi:poly(3-hydroxybutyrate) depolymerase
MEKEFTFTSSYDNTQQLAVSYIPEKCRNKFSPLLVVTHYWTGDRFTARKLNYYEECEKRGWLLVCPELHGRNSPGQTSLAALEAQHDVIDSIEYMKQTCNVDISRIYLTGRSMGGMLAEIMAAKYPHIFAAVMAGQGISDLSRWVRDIPLPDYKPEIEKECGAFSARNRFEYERRSSIRYAMNFQYVPLLLWHGTNDTHVPPEYSERLYNQIKKYHRFQEPVHWMTGAGHCADNFPASWICDRLQYYQNLCDENMNIRTRFFPRLSFVLDEARDFYWLEIQLRNKSGFAEVSAEIAKDVLQIKTKNVSAVSVDLKKIAQGITFSKYGITADGRVNLIVKNGAGPLISVSANKKRRGSLSF